MRPLSIWIGYDSREAEAFAVARESIARRITAKAVPINGIMLDDVKSRGLYWRPTTKRDGKLWDVISGAPMSTEFAISRFLTPHLATQGGLALFMDCDMLVRGNFMRLFNEIHDRRAEGRALWCVKHNHAPSNLTKMDDQVQTTYPRKNWSSLMVFDCDHAANKRLSLEAINAARGLDLHQFYWLDDSEIGPIDSKWNYLVGHTDLPDEIEPKVVHYTDGGPWFGDKFKGLPYADEWQSELRRWVCR